MVTICLFGTLLLILAFTPLVAYWAHINGVNARAIDSSCWELDDGLTNNMVVVNQHLQATSLDDLHPSDARKV